MYIEKYQEYLCSFIRHLRYNINKVESGTSHELFPSLVYPTFRSKCLPDTGYLLVCL